jgi:group I intron endonuclease
MKYPTVLSGIYKIQSRIHLDRFYIGSAQNIKVRWLLHISELRRNKHKNNKLQNHFNKYGESDLIFSLIVGCSKENLIAYEQFYIDVLNPYFNILKNAYSVLGYKHSEETKEYLRKINLGHKMTLEQNKKNRLARLGKPVWSKGIKFTELHRKHIAEVRQRKVIDISNNKIFNSIGDAANYSGIKYQTFYAQLSGHNINKTTFKFL